MKKKLNNTCGWMLLIFIGIVPLFSAISLENTYFREKQLEVPVREQAIIITDKGYFPKSLSVFRGEKVRFYLATTTEEPACVMMPSKNIFLSVEREKVSQVEVYFEEEGKVEFYCPTNKIKGSLTVLERPDDKRRRLQREIASEKRFRVWKPREE